MGELKIALIIMCTTLTAIAAQLRFHIGPIPYTMQNFAVILSGILLSPAYAFSSQLLYLLLICLGLPIATGFRGGIHVLLGYTGGYLMGFPITVLLMSLLTRIYLKSRNKHLHELSKSDIVGLLLLSVIAALPTYILGFIVFYHYAVPGTSLFQWASSTTRSLGLNFDNPSLLLFVASVLIFLPQDVLMDHLLAITLAYNITKILKAKGVAIP